MKIIRISLFLLSSLFLVACGNDRAPTSEAMETPNEENLNEAGIATDAQFFRAYANRTMMMMAMSQVAAEKAQHERVRHFADSLAGAHEKIFQEMQDLAEKMNYDAPMEMRNELKSQVDDFRATPAEAFDEAYLNQVIAYHEAIDEEARNLIEESEFDEIIDFARRISSNQYVHRRTARDLLADL